MKTVVKLDEKDIAMEVLKILKEREASGEEIAKKLGVSRTAVWKAISKLKKFGYDIETRKKAGYKLVGTPDLSPYEVAEACLNTEFKEIHYYVETDSTNQRAKEEMKEGLLVIAEKQSAGRGRLGRRWFSEEGGLYFSLVISPGLPIDDLPKITLLSGVAVCEALSFANAKLKWPNDVLINGRKVCGILSEIGGEVDSPLVIVGIGINVNNPIPNDLREKATSLAEVTGEKLSRAEVLEKTLREFSKYYKMLLEGRWDAIRQRWKELSDSIGKEVVVRLANREYRGLAVDIDESGGLLLKVGDRIERVYSRECFYVE
jgi:BirA family biotin operon repressor/biotin-[acetyl-CoA-carboxylase] ligase